ncbi:nuclear transport factor 2 family protein [Arenimonas sp.]|uniref:YybH family protein n=1 Tax=Arenimonas sp. TaxID=1872635 RepID=UPI0035B465B6
MIKLFWTSLLMLAAWACPGAGDCRELAESDRATLLAMAAESDAHWDAADAGRLAAMFAPDADFRLADRVAFDSREGILDYFTRSFAGRPAGMHHVTEIVALREVAPGVVMADGHVRLERETADGGRELLRRFVNHTLVVRDGDGWRFKALRAHPLPAEPAATPAG